MKILRKINKGLILTIIVLLALTVYLVRQEKQRNEDKPDIQKACEEFINFIDKYSVLPENLQKLTEKIDETKVEEYKKEMKTELAKLMVENEDVVNLQYQNLETALDESYNVPRNITTKIERKIIKITKYEFEGEQVTVTFKSNTKTISRYLNEQNKVQENQISTEADSDEICLQKVNGKWKIIYSNLKNNNYNEKEVI